MGKSRRADIDFLGMRCIIRSMEFKEPPADKSIHARFLRFRDRMVVDGDWSLRMNHRDLLDDLRQSHPNIREELRNSPGDFDAGFLYQHSSFPNELTVAGNSATLDLPARGHILTAREYTAGLIRRICPSHVVDSRTD